MESDRVPADDPSDLATRFRARLVEERDTLVREGDIELVNFAKTDLLDKVDDDQAPLSEMEQVIASNRNRERSERLARIVSALARLDDDPEAFGICESCEDPIPERRLELMPWVRRCARCQQAVESDQPGSSRRNVTDYR